MRIAFVTNILTPYRICLFDRLYDAFRNEGDEFVVFTMCKSKSDRPWKYDDLKREYTRALKSIQIRIKSYFFFFNCIRPINTFGPDIVVCAGSYFMPTVVQLLLSKKKYKRDIYLWTESHDKEQKNHSHFFMRVRDLVKRFSISRFDGFLYASILAKQFVAKFANKNAHYIYFPNTVDQDAFSRAYLDRISMCNKTLEKYNFNNKFIFLTPARLSKEKGLLEFLEIFKRSNLCSHSIWLIAGSGALKDVLVQKIKEYEVDVRLLGQCSQETIIELLSVTDCFLLPSFSDPNPLSVIEALWAGKPIFISNGVGNQNEAVIEGENGYIFNYKDPINASRLLDKVIGSSTEWRNRAASLSFSTASKIYDINKVVKDLVSQFH